MLFWAILCVDNRGTGKEIHIQQQEESRESLKLRRRTMGAADGEKPQKGSNQTGNHRGAFGGQSQTAKEAQSRPGALTQEFSFGVTWGIQKPLFRAATGIVYPQKRGSRAGGVRANRAGERKRMRAC